MTSQQDLRVLLLAEAERIEDTEDAETERPAAFTTTGADSLRSLLRAAAPRPDNKESR